jgi:hypothetical protein
MKKYLQFKVWVILRYDKRVKYNAYLHVINAYYMFSMQNDYLNVIVGKFVMNVYFPPCRFVIVHCTCILFLTGDPTPFIIIMIYYKREK